MTVTDLTALLHLHSCNKNIPHSTGRNILVRGFWIKYIINNKVHLWVIYIFYISFRLFIPSYLLCFSFLLPPWKQWKNCTFKFGFHSFETSDSAWTLHVSLQKAWGRKTFWNNVLLLYMPFIYIYILVFMIETVHFEQNAAILRNC